MLPALDLITGMPTAFETAELLFNQVFRYYGIPEDLMGGGLVHTQGLGQFYGEVGSFS